MKKVISSIIISALAVVAISVGAISLTEAATYPYCTKTCDMDTYLWYECCYYKKSPKSKKVIEVCEYGDQCYFPEM